MEPVRRVNAISFRYLVRLSAEIELIPARALVVFFRIDEARRTVVIVAIAHTRRELGYWRARLEP